MLPLRIMKVIIQHKYRLFPVSNRFLQCLSLFLCESNFEFFGINLWIMTRVFLSFSDYRICTSCYEALPIDATKKIKFCPVDNVEITEMFSDRSALLEIMKIRVFCFFKKSGCHWTGLIFHFLEHLKGCKYSVDFQVCEFSIIGCDKKDKQNALKVHVETDFALHLDLLGKDLNVASSSLNHSSALSETIALAGGECSKRLEEDSDGILAVRTSISAFKSRIESEQAKRSALFEDQIQVNRQIEELTTHSEGAINLESQELRDKFCSIEKQVLEIGKDNDNTSVTLFSNAPENVKDYGPKLKRLERDRKMRKENLADSDLKIRLFQATTTDGRYMWKIDNYPRRMKEAIEGKIVELYSPPLYSHIYGYKLCCKIYLNGKPNESCHGTHVSFYMILMKGEYDATLRFPFPRIFSVTLLGHNASWNVEKSIVPSTDEEFQMPKEEMNRIVGYPKFISHEELLASRYLWGDSLFFRIDFTQKSSQFSYYS